LGPAIGATLIAASLYASTSGGQAMLGRAAVAAALILAILLLPEGIVPNLRRIGRRAAAGHPHPPALRAGPSLSRDSGRGDAHGTPSPAIAGEGAERSEAGEGAPPLAPSGVEIRGVSKSFGGIRALNDVSLDVAPGEILGLVGPNGSGKTTLINVLSGHFRADRGSISVAGDRIEALPAHRIARRGVARTYQIPRLFAHLSVHDNVALAATFGTDGGAAEAEPWRWLAFTGLADKAQSLPAELNLHERKFLELARALAARPRLLLLDEVLSGLNPAEIDSAIRLIREIRRRGATIVFVEHLMRAVVELSDRVAVLNEGALFALGTPREVMRDPRVVSIYLGKAYAA
jgi:branched-chain amino acid transport system permease protein